MGVIVTATKYTMIQKPEESITYRTNLARLMDQLIVEKKLIRQKIIDLAMTKCLWINSAITL
jgi:hypothetical protein